MLIVLIKFLETFSNISYHINADISNIVTPIRPTVFKQLLLQYGYDKCKTEYLFKGFSEGFDLGYRGSTTRRNTSNNIPLRLGTYIDLWNKIMKEVEAKRYAGPFEKIPYDYYIQSPIGLVPKGKDQTRLIFHLSFYFNEQDKSFNACTPDHLCSVNYNDLDYAIRASLKMINNQGGTIYYSKTDVKSAFRLIPGRPDQYCWLIMCAKDPVTGKLVYLVDKCLPFGASVSCKFFQDFSDCLKYLIEARTLRFQLVTNYLDDFLFIGISISGCNFMITSFIHLCNEIGCPLSEEKTQYATNMIVFLGVLLDGTYHLIVIPEEKRLKALNIISWVMDRKLVTVKIIQKLTLNFLNKAIFAGRTFTSGMYAKLSTTGSNGKHLKDYHHVKLDAEFKADCLVWQYFLTSNSRALCRPFVDLTKWTENTKDLDFYSDSSAAEKKDLDVYLAIFRFKNFGEVNSSEDIIPVSNTWNCLHW